MTIEPSFEGWVPGPDVSLSEAIDRAFDYRGNVSLDLADGREITGYLFNRNTDAREPFVQLFDLAGDGPLTLRYTEIRAIRFTGKDTAAGNSYAAWLERKAAAKAQGSPTPQR